MLKFTGECLLEPKVDEIFELEGSKYKCVRTPDMELGCDYCAFSHGYGCDSMNCIDECREDEENVHFEEI